jgi:hypothetical protein
MLLEIDNGVIKCAVILRNDSSGRPAGLWNDKATHYLENGVIIQNKMHPVKTGCFLLQQYQREYGYEFIAFVTIG